MNTNDKETFDEFNSDETGSDLGSGHLEDLKTPAKAIKNDKISIDRLQNHIDYLEKLVLKLSKKITRHDHANINFVSIISHDLRSPFGVILTALDLLKESLQNKDIGESNLLIDIAENSAKETLSLLNDLLSWSISQNGSRTFNPKRIGLFDLVKSEIGNFKLFSMQKSIEIVNTVTPDLEIKADPQMVRTILRNLISNAIKYSSNGGEIRIKAIACGKFIQIQVCDNGVGLSWNARRKLFKKSSMHTTPGTNNENGVGLGLFLCKEFIEIHGGSIKVKSEIGKGAEFYFTLPEYVKV